MSQSLKSLKRQARQIAAERDLWKHQAQEAQAKLKSLGVTI